MVNFVGPRSMSDVEFSRVLTQHFSQHSEATLRLILSLTRGNGKPMNASQVAVVKEVASWPHIGLLTQQALDEALAYIASAHGTEPETFFYAVYTSLFEKRDTDRPGIDILAAPLYLTPGRRIRWRSSGAEYGLIEAVVKTGGINLLVTDCHTGRDGEIYIEQVKEIALTEDEAKKRNFGWPLATA